MRAAISLYSARRQCAIHRTRWNTTTQQRSVSIVSSRIMGRAHRRVIPCTQSPKALPAVSVFSRLLATASRTSVSASQAPSAKSSKNKKSASPAQVESIKRITQVATNDDDDDESDLQWRFVVVELVLAAKDNNWKLLLVRADVGDILKVTMKVGQHPDAEVLQIAEALHHGIARTSSSLQRLLSSIPGMGPARGRSVAEHLGPTGFEILENLTEEYHHETTSEERKKEIIQRLRPATKPTIGEALACKILEHWKKMDRRFHEDVTYKEFFDYLSRYGFPSKLIRVAHQWYTKDGTRDIRCENHTELEYLLEKNKYTLYHDGYLEIKPQEIDQIQPAVDPHDARRIEAYCVQKLRYAAKMNGYAAMPIEELASEVAQEINIDETHVLKYLNDLPPSDGIKRKRGVLVRYHEFIALPGVFSQEAQAASVLARLASSENLMELEIDPSDLEGLNEEQKIAVTEALRGNLTVITGAAGTGKTQCVKAIARVLERNRAYRNFAVHILAFTGRAAQRVKELTGADAKTIHRTFFKPRGDTKKKRVALVDEKVDEDLDVITIPDDNEKPTEEAVVIVDECSMIGVDVFDLLFGAAQTRYLIKKIILLGDVNQLQPIGPGRIFYDIVQLLPHRTLQLTQVMRQGGLILENAQRVLSGSPLRPGPDFKILFGNNLSQMVKSLAIDWMSEWKQAIVLTATRGGPKNVGVHELNRVLQLQWNPASPGKPEYLAVFPRGTRLKRPETWRLGDRVICVRNDYEKDIMNGQIGYIIDFVHGEQENNAKSKNTPPLSSTIALVPKERGAPPATGVVIKFDYKEEPVIVQAWEMEDLIEHAFAISVHKSQGTEFAKVAVVLQGIDFETKNMLYTAITRAKGECIVMAEGFPVVRSVSSRLLDLDKRHSAFHKLLAQMMSMYNTTAQ